MRTNRLLGFTVAALLWSAVLFGAGWLARSYAEQATTPAAVAPAGQPGDASTIPLLDEVWGHVRESFVGTVPSDTVRNYGVIRGALSTLNDRWTVLVEPQPRAIEREHLAGQFGGIGVDLNVDSSGRIVLTPITDSPAQNAGIRAGDILLGIDGVMLPDKPDFDEVAARVRGSIGTDVRITVRRAGATLEFTVTRANIQIPSVDWHVITATQPASPTIGYIAIHQFTERTGSEVKQAITELRKSGSQGYLIDLRDNGGGLLNAAVDVASQFLKDGVVLIERRHDQPDVTFPVNGDGTSGIYTQPLVVLINGNTASASEIVAGAIQDRQRGKLIGDKSFGKGSVQTIYDLSDGSSVHITSAKWLTPNKRTIDGEGLTPDIVVARQGGVAVQTQDAQQNRAVQELRMQAAAATVQTK